MMALAAVSAAGATALPPTGVKLPSPSVFPLQLKLRKKGRISIRSTLHFAMFRLPNKPTANASDSLRSHAVCFVNKALMAFEQKGSPSPCLTATEHFVPKYFFTARQKYAILK